MLHNLPPTCKAVFFLYHYRHFKKPKHFSWKQGKISHLFSWLISIISIQQACLTQVAWRKPLNLLAIREEHALSTETIEVCIHDKCKPYKTRPICSVLPLCLPKLSFNMLCWCLQNFLLLTESVIRLTESQVLHNFLYVNTQEST